MIIVILNIKQKSLLLCMGLKSQRISIAQTFTLTCAPSKT